MLDAKVAQLLNEQVNKEFYSAYLYLDFSIYYEEEGLDGFANWYKIQAQEERDHAMLMVQYLQNNGGKVTLEAIAKPDRELTSRLRVLELGLEHERYVTGLIHTLYEAAYSAQGFSDDAVPGLVRQGAGGGGEERRGPDQKDEASTARTPRGCICSTARWPPGLHRPLSRAVTPICFARSRTGTGPAPRRFFRGARFFLTALSCSSILA